MRIALIGGGIGGMTFALSLLDAGIDDVDIYESTTAVKELGVGINVLPHAVRKLTPRLERSWQVQGALAG
jgi:2-polyprenyl-6-methoxyphenol hydroxylase-like FAD-dependent oxidoreductase